MHTNIKFHIYVKKGCNSKTSLTLTLMEDRKEQHKNQISIDWQIYVYEENLNAS